MSRPSLAVALLVLALSAVAVAGAVTQPSTTAMPVTGTVDGEPNYLAVNASAVATSNTTAVTLDVSTAVSADSSSLQSEFETARFEAAYAEATTDEARRAVVENVTARFEESIGELEERNEEIVAAYATDSIDASTFLRERARVQATADHLREGIAEIRSALQNRLGGRLNDVAGRLEVLEGPISSTVAASVLTGGNERPVYVEVSDSGYTLAAISDGQYIRETYLGNEIRLDQPDQFVENGTGGHIVARDRAMELYPWVRENQVSPSSAFGLGSGVYRVTKGFPGGVMTVYLHGSTRNVFREEQTRTLSSVNTTQVVDRTADSVRLSVNRSFETGPVEITLRDDVTGAPIDGTITVGDRSPASVGEDGTLWIVEPRGDVRINATVGETELSTTFIGS